MTSPRGAIAPPTRDIRLESAPRAPARASPRLVQRTIGPHERDGRALEGVPRRRPDRRIPEL